MEVYKGPKIQAQKVTGWVMSYEYQRQKNIKRLLQGKETENKRKESPRMGAVKRDVEELSITDWIKRAND